MTSMSLWFQETLFTRHIRVKGFANNWTGSVGSCDKSPEDVGFFFFVVQIGGLVFFSVRQTIVWCFSPCWDSLGTHSVPRPSGRVFWAWAGGNPGCWWSNPEGVKNLDRAALVDSTSCGWNVEFQDFTRAPADQEGHHPDLVTRVYMWNFLNTTRWCQRKHTAWVHLDCTAALGPLSCVGTPTDLLCTRTTTVIRWCTSPVVRPQRYEPPKVSASKLGSFRVARFSFFFPLQP